MSESASSVPKVVSSKARITTVVDLNTKRLIQMIAIMEDLTLEAVVAIAIEEYVQTHRGVLKSIVDGNPSNGTPSNGTPSVHS